MAIDNPSDKIREIVGEDDKDPLGVSLHSRPERGREYRRLQRFEGVIDACP